MTIDERKIALSNAADKDSGLCMIWNWIQKSHITFEDFVQLIKYEEGLL